MSDCEKGLKKEYYPILDITKFVLALIIVFHHYQQCILGDYRFKYINFWDGEIYGGYACEFFFVISGFVAAINTNITEKTFGQYIKKKALRIYPMAVLSVVGFVIAQIVHKLLVGEAFGGVTPSIWRALNSVLLTFAGGAVSDIGLGLNNPLWYAGVLMLCYSWLYLLCYIAKKADVHVEILCAGMSILGLAGMQYFIEIPFLNSYSERGYAAFFLGVVLHYFYKNVNNRNVLCLSSGIILICTVLLGWLDFDTYFDNVWGILTYLIFPTMLFVLLWVGRNLKSEKWSDLGKISFEIYIWHFPLIVILIAICSYLKSNVLYSNGAMLVLCALVVAFAIAMYYLIEQRLNAVLKKFEHEKGK